MVGLSIVMAMVLVLPFSARWIEEQLEAFLLVMGCLAVSIVGLWTGHLVLDALAEPIKITLSVLVFGFVFRRYRAPIIARIFVLSRRIGLPAFSFIAR